MLDELDRRLESRGRKHVGYADDCLILCKSREGAERAMESIASFIVGKLFLKASLQRTTVNHVSRTEYLGYGFYRHKGKCRMRIHPKSTAEMRNRIWELTIRGDKWNNQEREGKLRNYAGGWINYYRYADMKSLTGQTDKWLHHRIRGVYWKQWKKARIKYKML